MRELEPPQHDRFVDSRMPDGKSILKALGTRVKGQLDKLIKHEVDESAGLDFTADIFGDEYDEADGEGKINTELDPEGKIKWQAKPIKVRAPRLSSPVIDEQGEQGATGGSTGTGDTEGGNGDDGSGNNGDGEDQGATGGSGDEPSEIPVSVSGFRVIYKDDDENSAKIYLSLPHAGEFVCKFYVSGQDSDELLEVTKSSYGELYANGVKVRASNMERLAIDLTFNDARNSALMVTAYAA